MLKYVIVVPNCVPEYDKKIRIIERKDCDPIEYDPIADFDDRNEAEKIMKHIIEVGIDAYLAEFQKKT